MIKVLIVDDKSDNIYLLQSMLDTSGFKTIPAKNGAEALGLLRTIIPDLIIADILMPVMDGFTLCRECKKDEILKNIPFFFYTATYIDAKDEAYALGLGADRFILKPQEPEIFIKIINDFLAEIKSKTIHPKKIIQQEEMVVLKEYNEVLIRKIEDKMLQTEKSEKELKKYAEELEKEIDERKKNEESLLKSEEYNRLLFTSSPIGLALCKMDGSLIDINPAYAKIIGRTIEETLKLNYRDITPEKYATQEAEQLKNLEETGHYGIYEKEYIHKDGHLVPVLLQGLILDRDGERFIWSSVEDITERKKAEIALQESQHLFQVLAEMSPVGIFRTTTEGNTTYVNPKWSELSGLSFKEAEGINWLKAVHPVDRENLFKSWENNLQSKNESSAEYRFLKSDGNVVWVMGKAVPELIGNKVAGYIGTITDITDMKRAEESIIHERRMLRTLIDNLPDMIYIKDIECRKVIANIADIKNIGFEDEKEVLGKTDIELFPGPIGERGYNDDLMVTGTGEKIIGREEDFVDAKGVRRWLLTTKIPLFDKDGKITGLVGVGHDITERKLADEDLQISEKQLSTIYKTVGDVIYYLAIEAEGIYRFISVSQTFYNVTGLSPEMIIGKLVTEVIPQPSLSLVLEKYKQAIEEKTIVKWEETSEYPTGKLIGEVSITPVVDNNGLCTHLVGSVHDITNMKLAEKELIKAKEKAEESDRLKTAFLHNISHEVRTPMNAIVGFSDLILDSDLTPEMRNEFIQTIVQSSNQLLSIISQIVSMATIETGQEKIYEKEISLNSIFRIVSDQFRSEALRKNISLKSNTELMANEDKIKTDETKLIQIISNLLGNALKFTKKGSIDFGYAVKDKYLEFYFKDTGIGIPKDLQEKVFERFRQVETTMSREYEGAGLGLSISKAYVELLGGKIWLTSRLGEGSVFYFTIPYNKVSLNKIPDKGVADKYKSEPEPKKTITLLVAEDEYNNFKLLEQYLSNENIVVIHAANGSEAVEICKKNRQINLVLMDLKMPVMDGFEATKSIKEFRPDLPVIAQTAYVRDVDKSKAIACGCSDFLSKPFKKEELLSMIREHLVFD
jgi:PAS domain S-box-containing protein